MFRVQFSLRTLLALTFAVGTLAGTYPWWYPQLGIVAHAFTPIEKRPIAWRDYSPELLAQAKANGKPVLLFFDADWDASTKVNVQVALEQPETRRTIAASDILPIRVDLTNYNEDARQVARNYGQIPTTPLMIVDSPSLNGSPIVMGGIQSTKSVSSAICAATDYDPTTPNWDPFQSPLVGAVGLVVGFGLAHWLARNELRQAAGSSSASDSSASTSSSKS